MPSIPKTDLLESMRLTRAGRLTEATAVLQRMLGSHHPASPGSSASSARRGPPVIDGVAEPAGTAQAEAAPQPRPAASTHKGSTGRMPFSLGTGGKLAVPDALQGFLEQISQGGLSLPGTQPGGLSGAGPRVPAPDGAQFLTATFSNEAGSRPYKLYIPSSYQPGQPMPLIVMLHGCTQSPDDFAAGTRMNEVAEEHTCLVAYPGQTTSANMQKCWNWFNESDQRRGRGEPSLIAGITREIMRGYTIDPQRVYVAGLSAGGAAAAIMGDAYPDIFAAIGVHSGLACGAASDMPSAFAAMRGSGAAGATARRSGAPRRIVPAIVFHGDRDGTVNSKNADAIVAQSAQTAELGKHVEQGRVPGGHAYSRTLSKDASGRVMIEQWVVHGAGHAWFGGSTAGSYTDPQGPDATREMLRFFLDHPHPAPARAA